MAGLVSTLLMLSLLEIIPPAMLSAESGGGGEIKYVAVRYAFTCTICFGKEFKIAKQMMPVYPMEEPVMKDFWKSAQTKHGKQLVGIHSPAAMPKLFAGNWGTHNH